MNSGSSLLGGDDQDNEICPSLTYTQRIYGFVACFVLGVLMSIGAWITLFNQDYTTFGVLYTIGNIIALASTLFLSGPKKQVKKMFAETRWIATVVYFLCMIFTVIAACVIKSVALTIISIILQWLAMTWYALSYIPFARAAVKNCCAGIFA